MTGSSHAWGTPLHPHSGNNDIVVLKLTSAGVLQWHTCYGSASNDYGYAIAVDDSGNVYVTGYSAAGWGTPLNPHSGGWDIVALKLTSAGAYQWHTFYGSAYNDAGSGIAVDGSGNVYVTGYSAAGWGTPLNPHSGGWDIVALKLSGDAGPPTLVASILPTSRSVQVGRSRHRLCHHHQRRSRDRDRL